jgi:hypothetical protein
LRKILSEGVTGRKGIVPIDASEIIRKTVFGWDLSNPWVGGTLGAFDPVGAHASYQEPEVFDLIVSMYRDLSHDRVAREALPGTDMMERDGHPASMP